LGTDAIVATTNYWGEPTTSQLRGSTPWDLSKVYDSQKDSKVGQVVLIPYLTSDPNSGPPPTITKQPENLTVNEGQSAAFTVVATSKTTIRYQWLFNGVDITGANESTYTIASAKKADEGSYSVKVANDDGYIVSDNASLKVRIKPVISTQPIDILAPINGTAKFSVVASGEMLSYQWYFNSSPLNNSSRISGATTAQLAFNALQTSDEGPYYVVVSNEAGNTPSSSAKLIVVLPPKIVEPPKSQVVTPGSAGV